MHSNIGCDNPSILHFTIASIATIMDRIESLKAFIEVADRQSFAAAARARRVSAAGVSRAIAELERDLGVSLFRRTTRRVALTAEGAAYLEHCRHALTVLDEAARATQGKNSQPQGLMVVSAPVVFGRMHVLPIVTDMLRTHPALRVELTLTDRFARLVDEGVDVAVRIADLTDSSLVAVRLGETRRVLIASPSYLARRGNLETSVQLREHDLIAFDAFAPNGEWRFGSGSRSAIRIEPQLLTNSIEAAIESAIAGVGITRAFCYQVREHIAAGRLVEVLAEQAPPPVPISLLFQSNRQGMPNVRAFVDAAKSGMRTRLD